MGKEEFKAMVKLIEKLIGIRTRYNEHPTDHPRVKALSDERKEVITEAAREIIDELWKEEDIFE